MNEFITGFLVGVVVAIVLHMKRPRRSGAAASLNLWERAGLRQSRTELKAENRALRTALRLARTWAFQSRHQFLVSIIDRTLSDEAGA